MNSRALSSLYSESVKNIASTGSFPPFVEKKNSTSVQTKNGRPINYSQATAKTPNSLHILKHTFKLSWRATVKEIELK